MTTDTLASPTLAAPTPEDASTDSMALARSAADNALAFAELLAGRLATLADAFRAGDDQDALLRLGESADDLEHFLTFIVLVAEIIETSSPSIFADLHRYRGQLMTTLEGLQPALGDLDLVEVADTLEHDLVASLADYRELNTPVLDALQAA